MWPPPAVTRSATAAVLLGLLACSDRRDPAWLSLQSDVRHHASDAASSQRGGADDIAENIKADLADRTGSGGMPGASTEAERQELVSLYGTGGHAPLWLSGTGAVTQDAHDALASITHAEDDGLAPGGYHQRALNHLRATLDSAAATAWDRARFDVVLSSAMLRYLRHVHTGVVDPRAIGFRLDIPPDREDAVSWLRTALETHRIVQAVADARPQLAQYAELQAALARYRPLAAAEMATESLPLSTARVRPGDQYNSSGTLFRQLIALGDLPAGSDPPTSAIYDGTLVDGVRRFQIRHGLDGDGVIGERTLAALRIPLTWRVRQLELALERLRWLPHVNDRRLVVLNIPMFRLWVWDSVPLTGEPLFGMNAIVGRALKTQTPVFVEEMREVIFRPYWNVPPSILRGEILPKIGRDPGYLEREQMEIVRGDGDNAQAVEATSDNLMLLRQGVLRLRQRPGASNALGLIKFVFPNAENVYMHGTPAQALFAQRRRDFSHGCVRVQDPVALAEWVLQDMPEWSRERILAAMDGPRPLSVRLTRPIRVILFYTTAAVMPEDGTVHFAEDIYRHDERLDQALAMARSAR